MTKRKLNKKGIALIIASVLLLVGGGAGYAVTQMMGQTNPVSQTSSSTKAKTVAGTISTSGATQIDLANLQASDHVEVSGSTVTITGAGTYEITGNLSQGQILVAAPDDAEVNLVLNGISLANNTDAAILIKSADKVNLQTAKGSENTVQSETSSQENTAAIFSHDDLTLSGTGSLSVKSSQTAIQSKDTLEVNGGTYDLTADNDGLKGKDQVQIYNGILTVKAQSDGIKASNDTESGKGNVLITGGSLKISAQSQAIKAVNALTISGGEVSLESAAEGVEASQISIQGGKLTVSSQEDGLNAASDTGAAGSIEISGGTLIMKAGQSSQGDVFDVNNGPLTISGGTVTVTSPSQQGDYSTFDADNGVTITDNVVTVDGTKVTSNNISQFEMMGPGGMGGGFGGR